MNGDEERASKSQKRKATPTTSTTTSPPPHHFADLPRVLSVQSHVVSGRVGNRAAVFPLQLHRFDVDEINTVSFSNHTGYRSVAGTRLSGEGLEDLLSGLERNGLLSRRGGKGGPRSRPGYSYVLTGYVGRAETLRGIAEAIRGMTGGGTASDDGDESGDEDESGGDEGEKPRKRSARPLVVVDPVMGDHDRGRAGSGDGGDGGDEAFLSSLYVPEDVPQVYRSLLPLADVVTPNAFEAEMLLADEGGGRRSRIHDEASAVAACSALHERGPSIVVLTSVAFPSDPSDDGGAKGDTLTIYASQCARVASGSPRRPPSPSAPSLPEPPDGATPGSPAVWKLVVPRVDAPFTGTGDLLASLLVAFLHKASAAGSGAEGVGAGGGRGEGEGRDVGWALERAAAAVRAVVEATVAGAAAEAARAEAEADRRRRRRGGEEGDGGRGEERGQRGERRKPPLSTDYWSSPRAVAARELRLVQCADALLSPTVVARAERIR